MPMNQPVLETLGMERDGAQAGKVWARIPDEIHFQQCNAAALAAASTPQYVSHQFVYGVQALTVRV